MDVYLSGTKGREVDTNRVQLKHWGLKSTGRRSFAFQWVYEKLLKSKARRSLRCICMRPRARASLVALSHAWRYRTKHIAITCVLALTHASTFLACITVQDGQTDEDYFILRQREFLVNCLHSGISSAWRHSMLIA